MKQFVIRKNIERYTELLKRSDLEESRRLMLERLLEEERAKLAANEESDGQDDAATGTRPDSGAPRVRG